MGLQGKTLEGELNPLSRDDHEVPSLKKCNVMVIKVLVKLLMWSTYTSSML